MRDRTEEFIQKVSEKVSSRASVHFVELDSRENETSKFMINFLIKVEEIYDMFAVIDKRIKEVTDLQSSLLEYTGTDENLLVYYEKIKRNFKVILVKITGIKSSLEATKCSPSDTELRICNTQLLTLERKLTCSVSNYYNIQENYKEKCKERVKRQAQIMGADITKIDLDAAIQKKTETFMQVVFPDYNVAYHYIHELEKRLEEYKRLERSIEQLRDLFFDMELIVRADQGLIQRIDKHAEVIDVLVAQGTEQVKDYQHAMKTHKFKYYICCCCVGFMVTVVVLTILTTFA